MVTLQSPAKKKCVLQLWRDPQDILEKVAYVQEDVDEGFSQQEMDEAIAYIVPNTSSANQNLSIHSPAIVVRHWHLSARFD